MIEKKFLKNNLVYLSSIVIGGGIGYLFNFILARNITVSQFGEFQGIISVMAIISIFLSAFSYFSVKYSSVFALHNDISGQLEFISFLKKKFIIPVLLFFAFFVFLLPFAKNFLHLKDYGGLVIIGMTILVSFYSSFYINSLQGWSNFTVISVIGIVAVLIKVISGYLVTLFSPSSSSVMLAFFLPTIASWQIAKYYIEKKWKNKNEKKGEKKEIWKEKYFSGVSFKKSFINILFFSAGMTALGSVDILIVRNISDPLTAGYYGALSVLGKVIFSLNMAFIAVLFPDACSDGYLRQPAKIRSVLGSYLLILIVSIPVMLVFYFFPNYVVNPLFGNKYFNVSSYLWIFGLMAFFLSLITLEAKLALARHDFHSTWLLIATTAIFSGGIYFYHESLQIIIWVVTVSLAIGWVGIMALNLLNRFNYQKQLKT